MQIKKIFFAIIIGYIFGVGTFYFFVPTSSEIKIDSTQTDQTQNTGSTETVELENCNTPAAPPCPCIFSDKILEPPEFDSRIAEELKTNFEGEVLVRWLPREGAKRYAVLLETENGKLVKSYSSPRLAIYLKDIPMPKGQFEAKYIVKLVSHNGKDEAGPKSKGRVLQVKAQASIVAPEVQEIKVEE